MFTDTQQRIKKLVDQSDYKNQLYIKKANSSAVGFFITQPKLENLAQLTAIASKAELIGRYKGNQDFDIIVNHNMSAITFIFGVFFGLILLVNLLLKMILGVAIKAKVCAIVVGFPAHLVPAHLVPAHLVPAHLVPAHLVPAHQLTENACGGAAANVNQLTNIIKSFNKTLKMLNILTKR